MPIDITINSITGTSPYNIFLCDTGLTLCVYITQVTTGDLPYTFQPPPLFSSLNDFSVKIIDSGFPCAIIVTPTPSPIAFRCSPIFLNSTDFRLYTFETTGYTTEFLFDPGFVPSAMTRSDNRLWLYDGVSSIYEYDTTLSTVPTLLRQIDTSIYGINIFGMCPFTSTTELLVTESTDNVSVIDISSNVAGPPVTLYTTGGNNQYCNLTRDNNIGITYLKRDLVLLRAYYDDGTQYSSGSWPSGNLTGIFRDPDTAEIYGINENGQYQQASQSPGSIVFTPGSVITPDDTLAIGVAQAGNCEPPLISARFFVSSTTGITGLSLTSTTFSWINWGEDIYISGGTGAYSRNHTYTSTYDGSFTINTYGNVIGLQLTDPNPYTGALKMTAYTSELTKFTSLQRYVTQSSILTFGGLDELPSTITYLNPGNSNLSGTTSDFPPTLVWVAAGNGGQTITGDVINLPSTLQVAALSGTYCITGNLSDIPTGMVWLFLVSCPSLTGNTSDYPPGLVYLTHGDNSFISGSTSGFPSSLQYINIFCTNTISGDTSGLPNVDSITTVPENNNATIRGTLSIGGQNTISGDVSGLPPNAAQLNFTGFNTISGNTANIPSTANTSFEGFNTISGNVEDLPKPTLVTSNGFIEPGHTIIGDNTISGNIGLLTGHTSLRYLRISQRTDGLTGNTIGGNLSELSGMTALFYLIVEGANTISGDISTLPPNLSELKIKGFNTMSGDISTLQSSTTSFTLWGNNTITGDVSILSNTLNLFDVRGNNTIFGGWSGFSPSTMNVFVLSGANIDTSVGSASGMVFPSGMMNFQWYPTGTTPDVSIVDDILFAATAQTSWLSAPSPYFRGISLLGTCPTPSASGLLAVSALTGSPYFLTIFTN